MTMNLLIWTYNTIDYVSIDLNLHYLWLCIHWSELTLFMTMFLLIWTYIIYDYVSIDLNLWYYWLCIYWSELTLFMTMYLLIWTYVTYDYVYKYLLNIRCRMIISKIRCIIVTQNYDKFCIISRLLIYSWVEKFHL